MAAAAFTQPTRPGVRPPGMPRGAWLALVALVLAAHVSLLHTAIGSTHTAEAAPPRPFTTRSVLPPPPVAAVVPAPPPARPAPTARPARPAPPTVTQAAAVPAPRSAPDGPPDAATSASFESNRPQVHVEYEYVATNLAANDTSRPADAPAAPAPVAQPSTAVVAATPNAADPAPTTWEVAAAPGVPPATPAQPAPPVTVPGALRLDYAVSGEARGIPYSAQGSLVFRHDANSYEARAEISVFLMGARSQTSHGRLTAQGLAPTRFVDKSRNERAAHFDRERGRITFSANTPEAPLLPGAQDRLSVLMQLGALLAGAPARYPPGTSITVWTAGPRDAESWQFTVAGPETVKLPAGETATVRLTRAPRREFDQRVEVWLAPSLGYLPARIRITQANGDFVDQQLRASGPP